VIGFGTGVTTGELAALQGTREVDVAEISSAVIEAAPLFDYGNQGASRSPKVRIQRGDAYRTLLRSTGTYDVIVSEPSNPWVTGVEMLFSQEFLQAARDRLSPGGVYAQWFHLYEVDERSVELVLRTYASVFPHVSVWFAQGPDLLLLGFDRPTRALDAQALAARFARPDFTAGFARAGIGSFAELLAHELLPLGTLHATANPGEIHTLRHPILSYRAARAFFRGNAATLPRRLDRASITIGAHNSLLRRYSGASDGPLREAVLEAAFFETCGHRRVAECTALRASWLHDYPRSERRREAVKRLPPRAVPPRVVAQIAALFGPARSNGDVPLPAAVRATNQFVNYYHHAVPFDSRVIEERWKHCVGKAKACQQRGRRVAKGLGFELGRGAADAP
jgi:SAM-dependent methyltransferase